MGTPWPAERTDSLPARSRIAGSTLVPEGATCMTTASAAASSPGRSATRSLSASTPPAEAPITISGGRSRSVPMTGLYYSVTVSARRRRTVCSPAPVAVIATT